MKTSTLGGLAAGLGTILLAFLLDGGEISALINVSAGLIVFGGTIGAVLVSFPLARVIRLPHIIARTLVEPKGDIPALVRTFVTLSERARRQGLLSLEEEAQRLKDPYFQKGLLLVVDGIDAEVVRDTMEIEMQATEERHERNYSVLEAMGGFAPTMGIIGTVMGLIHVLSGLENPSELGPAIAVAFVATLYGVASANLVWLPLAGKLKVANQDERARYEIILTGLLSVQAGDNPRITREKLEAFLPAAERRKAATEPAKPAGAALETNSFAEAVEVGR